MNMLTALNKVGSVVYENVMHPVHALQGLAGLALHADVLFIAVALVGLLFWMFGLNAGKKMVQWSIAIFAVVAILSGAL